MSVHLRSNSVAARVFIGKHLSAQIQLDSDVRFTPDRSRVLLSSNKSSEDAKCLPEGGELTSPKEEFSVEQGESAKSFGHEKVATSPKLGLSPRREVSSKDSETLSSTPLVGTTSALPSAPVHLQETVDSLLFAPEIKEYVQGMVCDVMNEESFTESGKEMYSSPQEKAMRPFEEMQNNYQQDRGSPESGNYEGFIPPNNYSQRFCAQEQDQRSYNSVIHHNDPRKPVIQQQPNSVGYSVSPQLYMMSSQQQLQYVMPVNSYDSQSMIMVRFDYQQQQLHPQGCEPGINMSQPQAQHPVIPELFENDWNCVPQAFRKGHFPQNQNNAMPCVQQQNSSKLYQTIKKRRRRTSQRELEILENHFKINPLPSYTQREQLARDTGMTPRSVQVWFQNKRQSLKKKNLANVRDKLSVQYHSQTRARQVSKKLQIFQKKDDEEVCRSPIDTQPQQNNDKVQDEGQTSAPRGYAPRISSSDKKNRSAQPGINSPESLDVMDGHTMVKEEEDPDYYQVEQNVNFLEKSGNNQEFIHVPREEYVLPDYGHQRHEVSQKSPGNFPFYPVPSSQPQKPEIQDCDAMFSQSQDSMATLAALAAIASGRVNNY